MFVEVFLSLCAILATLTIWWQRSSKKYWEDRGVSYIPGAPFVGALKESVLFRKSTSELFNDLYNDEKTKNEPISGFYSFHTPGLIIREPELIKRILVTDFNCFTDRRVSFDPNIDIIATRSLPFARGEMWRKIRNLVSPIFTTVKLKNFLVSLKEVCEIFEVKLAKDTSKGFFEYDVRDLFSSLIVDMISRCAFGVNANSLNNSESEFLVNVRKMTDFTFRQAFVFSIGFFFPELSEKLKFTAFPESVNKFMRRSINHVIEEREKSGAKCNDLVDILITMKNTQGDIFYGDALISQAAVFLGAGHHTVSVTLALTMYKLAKHPEIQEKLRGEIQEELKNHGEFSYESINQFYYLQMIVLETLRLYPVLPFLDRVYQPSEDESYSLEPFHKFSIPRGMPVYIPAVAIHRDPKFYPDPNTFNPERFRDNTNNTNDTNALFLAFGLGPRNCIGSRLGMFMVKLGIISVLKSYRVECCERTPPTIRIDKKALILQSEDPVNLVFRKL